MKFVEKYFQFILNFLRNRVANVKRLGAVAALVVLPQFLWAQNAPSSTSQLDGLTLALLAVSVLIAAVAILLVAAAVKLAMIFQEQTEGSKPAEERLSFWEKIGGLQAFSKEKDLLLHEEYDGIKELDNPVPAWFNALFYGTIVIGIIYLFHYHYFQTGKMQGEEYVAEVQAAEISRAEYLKMAANSIDESNVTALTDASALAKGKETFMKECAACHGNLGEGKVGPNMTDNAWIHGGKITDVFKTIKYGVVEKGMVSWQKKLNPLQMQEVASYILTLKGTNPPNPKAAEGKVEE
jgi:cytochrome c oxidase cbb3-type subunit III